MLNKKLFRDILKNKSQFITIFLMVLIGVMVYVGIEAYSVGMKIAAENFYTNNNLQDLNVIGAESFNDEDIKEIKNINNVKDVERLLSVTATDDIGDKTYFLNFIESNNIDKFYVVDGIGFDVNKKGAWIDEFYAKKNNLKVGDIVKIKYDSIILDEEIIGLINVPDHIYDIKDSSQLIPNREASGFVYLSINELPESYVKNQVMNAISKEKQIAIDENQFDLMMPDFNYKDYVFYNLIVDVDSKDNVNDVKAKIEDKLDKVAAIIRIEDTTSYEMYEGEMTEGEAFVGIFSGLFLFIALLSVITTMTRVIQKQKLQIGTLKALGFKNRKIIMHYIGYGFWVSLFGSLCGIVAGRYFIGNVFMNLQMTYFELPNNGAVIVNSSYLVSILVVLGVSIVTYLTCRKELLKRPVDSLRNEIPKVKESSLDITTKSIFKNMKFSSKWNLRDILRNKFRTVTAIVGICGCSMLIVCAFGMLDSEKKFIDIQFSDLYNFEYKLSLKEDLSEESIMELEEEYSTNSSKTLGIEYIKDDTRISNNVFVNDSNDMIRFVDNKGNFIKIDNNEGVYVTYKLAETNGYRIGDVIEWHIYGSKDFYKSKIVGFNKDPQNQNITVSREYYESLGLKYTPDSIYTNKDLSNSKEIKNVELISSRESLRSDIEEMLSMLMTMIVIISVFAVLLGIIIISNMSVLSFTEKEYQFATLKVLGFKNKQIKDIFVKQNIWITIISIIIGLPSGYYLTSWLFKACLDANYDFGTYILPKTYILAGISTVVVSLITSYYIARKIKTIDMVASLKANE